MVVLFSLSATVKAEMYEWVRGNSLVTNSANSLRSSRYFCNWAFSPSGVAEAERARETRPKRTENFIVQAFEGLMTGIAAALDDVINRDGNGAAGHRDQNLLQLIFFITAGDAV